MAIMLTDIASIPNRRRFGMDNMRSAPESALISKIGRSDIFYHLPHDPSVRALVEIRKLPPRPRKSNVASPMRVSRSSRLTYQDKWLTVRSDSACSATVRLLNPGMSGNIRTGGVSLP